MMAKKPKKWLLFLDTLDKMPETFTKKTIYGRLFGRWFGENEVPAYLMRAESEGLVKRIGNGVWKRTGEVNRIEATAKMG